MKRPAKAAFALWSLASAVVAGLLGWCWASLSPDPLGTVRVIVNAPRAVGIWASTNQQKIGDSPSATTAGHQWDQVITLPLYEPKVKGLRLTVKGADKAAADVKTVTLLDRDQHILWTAPDPKGLKWAMGRSISFPRGFPKMPVWLAYSAGALGLLLAAGLAWQAGRQLFVYSPSPLAYAGVCALAFLGSAFAYSSGIEMIRGAPVASEAWLCDIQHRKIAALESMPAPRTICIGGSSGLYGVDAAMMSKESGSSVVNQSLHAGLPLSYHLEYAEELSQPGDTVLVHLENQYWRRPDVPTSWEIDEALAWGARGSARQHFHITRLEFLTRVAPARLLAGLIASADSEAFAGSAPIRVILPSGKEDWTTRNANVAIGPHGDMVTDVNRRDITPEQEVVRPFDQDAYCKQAMDAYLNKARKKGVKVYYAYPATMAVPEIDFRKPDLVAWVDQMRGWLEERGVMVLGRPEDMQQAPVMFLDSPLHLTPKGREIHTRKLLELLRAAGWPSSPISPK